MNAEFERGRKNTYGKEAVVCTFLVESRHAVRACVCKRPYIPEARTDRTSAPYAVLCACGCAEGW